MVFGVAMDRAMGFTVPGITVDYNAFFLAGVLGMASFAIASNTAWSFFMDRDNGIFYEMLTYPMSRGQYLFGKVLFNVVVALVQAFITVVLGAVFLGIPFASAGCPLLFAGVVIGTAGWFFFYAIFALRIRRNDAFNTVTSIFYFVFLFASSMFYPLDPLPRLFRVVGYANPITWQVDILRYATIGLGNAERSSSRARRLSFSPRSASASRCTPCIIRSREDDGPTKLPQDFGSLCLRARCRGWVSARNGRTGRGAEHHRTARRLLAADRHARLDAHVDAWSGARLAARSHRPATGLPP